MSKLTDYVQSKGKGIPFMEGREKEDLRSLLDSEVTIKDYDFLNGDNGEYAVFIIAEDDTKFYFGSSVVTDALKDLDNAGLKEDVRAEGLKVKLVERISKNGKRKYIGVTYID